MIKTRRRLLLAGSGALAGCGGSGGGSYSIGPPSPAPAPPPASAWTEFAPLADGPRQEHGVGVANGEIYVVGGFDETRAGVADVEAYNPATNAWRRVTPLPMPLHHPNVASARGRVYVVGALQGANFAATGVTLELDPATSLWTQRASMPAGTERGASAVAAIGDLIYVAGGYRGAAVNQFSVYNAATNTWQALIAMPTAREHLVGAALNGLVFALAGRNAAGLRAEVEIFNPQTGNWSSGRAIPTARGGCMGGVLNNRIHVFGGEGNAGHVSGVFNQNEAYDPALDTWSVFEPMRTPRHGAQAAAFNGRLFVPGGATVQGFGAVAISDVFAG